MSLSPLPVIKSRNGETKRMKNVELYTFPFEVYPLWCHSAESARVSSPACCKGGLKERTQGICVWLHLFKGSHLSGSPPAFTFVTKTTRQWQQKGPRWLHMLTCCLLFSICADFKNVTYCMSAYATQSRTAFYFMGASLVISSPFHWSQRNKSLYFVAATNKKMPATR